MTRFWEDYALRRAKVYAGEGTGWIGGGELGVLADAAVSHLPSRTVFALLFASNLPSVATYLGALRNGHIPLLLSSELSETLLATLCERYDIGFVFDGGAEAWRRASTVAEAGPLVHPALGLLMSTSGSTGSPKLVRLSLDNLASNAASICQYLSLTLDDRAMTSLPLSYSYGLSVLNSHLAAGAGVVLSEAAITTQPFWQLFRAQKVTGLAGVPTSWRMLRRMRFERMQLPSLRYMTQAGGKLDPDEIIWLGELAANTGRSAYIMYGQTEATARIAYLPPDLILQKPGSIGHAIPGGELGIVDALGEAIEEPDIEGQLTYRGPNVMLGYAESVADFARGPDVESLNTGDLARRDRDGHYWITGRMKSFVKLFGNRFGLDEVEQELRRMGFEAGAVGRDDLLMIGVVTSPEKIPALRQRLAEHYRLHQSALSFFSLDRLPRNDAGKLLHGELQHILDHLAASPTNTPKW
ncbi:AMP-binding protein [Rubrivivax gelatinosus]|uniref:AMP-dependent synthetase and ligase n=1 Tax=Rubrivivax gelatinosus (strain NBRC 100245 / IL144) TaxID=983917 RepID=I0HWT1_RUBGI|nr:AMP-binding protein [Rubrivivax gelatinosus]BAL97468.1 AMP-dependent synthetase and ligase [Rubrivivax gelatinosus IL144]